MPSFRSFRSITLLAGSTGVCALAVAFLILGVLHRSSTNGNPARRPRRADLEVGERICRPDGKEWTKAGGRAVIIVTSNTCPICSANAEIDDAVESRARERGLPVYYLLSNIQAQDDRSRQLTNGKKDVVRVNLYTIGVTRVPSMLSVDENGMVLSQWTGAVPQVPALSVIDRMLDGERGAKYTELSATSILQESRYETVQILRFRETATVSLPSLPYKTIPIDELSVRAQYELSRTTPLVVDCATAQSPFRCQDVLIGLAADGFSKLSEIGLQKRGASDTCAANTAIKQ